MSRGKIRGSRKSRVALAGALAVVAAMAVAGTAQATTANVDMNFDHGLLKLGGSGTPIDIVGDTPPQPVLHSAICTDTAGGCTAVGNFTVTVANFDFPPFTSDVSGVPGETATVDLIPDVNVTGNYNVLTGALTTNASNYTSKVGLAGPINAHCQVSPISLAFSTAKTTPFQGVGFTAQGDATNPTSPIHGVIDADWATLPTPGDDPDVAGDDSSTCSSVLNVFTTGAGGIGLGNGIEPVLNTPPPDTGGGTVTPPPTTAPKKKKCKKGFKLKKVHGKKKCVKSKKK
jgi:hypothetical protein